MKNKKLPFYIVRGSKIHGKGVFARKDITKGIKIIEYVGNLVSKKEGLRIYQEQLEKSKKTGAGAVYLFQLNKKHDIDGNVSWNPAKFINHSCEPNCKFEIINDRIWITSLREIKKDEELSYDYDYDLVDYKEHPCRCGSKNCLKYVIGKRYRKKFERLKDLKTSQN